MLFQLKCVCDDSLIKFDCVITYKNSVNKYKYKWYDDGAVDEAENHCGKEMMLSTRKIFLEILTNSRHAYDNWMCSLSCHCWTHAHKHTQWISLVKKCQSAIQSATPQWETHRFRSVTWNKLNSMALDETKWIKFDFFLIQFKHKKPYYEIFFKPHFLVTNFFLSTRTMQAMWNERKNLFFKEKYYYLFTVYSVLFEEKSFDTNIYIIYVIIKYNNNDDEDT